MNGHITAVLLFIAKRPFAAAFFSVDQRREKEARNERVKAVDVFQELF